MDRHLYSKVRHSTLSICSPLNQSDIEAASKEIGPLPNGRILEIGCGKAEILARLMEATNARGLGIDLPDSLADQLSPFATQQRNSNKLEVRFQDASEFIAHSTDAFDAIVFSGASHAVGGLGQLPFVAKKLLKPKGWLILGELIWGDTPDSEFLKTLEMREDDLPKAADVPELFASAKMKNIFWHAVSNEQFFQYEKTLYENGTSYALSRPGDSVAAEIGEQSRSWFDLMNRAGLKFFSFGWGLFQS